MSNSTAMPFSVARSDGRSLVDQVVDGIKRAIETGRYAVGDIIPSTRDMSEALGVSRIVTRAAVRKLADAGYVSPRQGIGCVVLNRGEKLWKGHILLVMRGEYGTYYSNVLIGVIREEMIKAGYLVSTVATPFGKNGKPDTAALSAALRQSVDLAILIFDNPTIERCIVESGVKFVLVGDRPSKAKTCVGSVIYRRDAAAREFAPLLEKQGVRTLMEVGAEAFADAKAAVESVGIGYSSWVIPARDGSWQPEGTELAAMEAFSRRLAKGRTWLPDVLYFSDDYTASGALKSLMSAGVRIPDDVRVITWSNRGNGPVFPFPVDYVQLDPRADGRQVAELCGLRKEKGRGSATIDSRYVRGRVG